MGKKTLTRSRDWKKLTFYYFADSYINFNSLVTDLFKIYKTRIWMSAINPASFASPTLGIQAPSGIGPGAVGLQRNANNAERRQNQPSQAQQEPQQPTFAGIGPNGRSFQGLFDQSAGGERPPNSGSGYGQGGYPYSHAGAPGGMTRNGNMPYAAGVMPSLDNYGFLQSGDFSVMRSRFQTPPQVPGAHEANGSPLNPQADWNGAFQGLSLHSR